MTQKHKVYIETFGCQMNLNDTEIVKAIMIEAGFGIANEISNANVILLNTCSIRENAEDIVRNKIEYIYHKIKKRQYKTIFGVLGCMAERLGEKLLLYHNVINLVVGPDEYRKLPDFVNECFEGASKVAIEFNKDEVYNDIIPFRENGVSAWLSIMRGCNNFCSYCIVPYVRGRERSRSMESILREVDYLIKSGIKEITLLGQNVNNYLYDETKFPRLLEEVAKRNNEIRIRFLTSHPKNITSDLIDTIAKYDNICPHFHLPLQSGSNRILEKMNRKYTTEKYLSLTNEIKNKLPIVSITTDIIAGYPTETLADHQATLDVMKEVNFDSAFMFRYSPREGTKSFSEIDDIAEDEKIRRLNEIIDLQNKISKTINYFEIGKVVQVLVDGIAKKKENQLIGRTATNKNVVFENINNNSKIGDFVSIRIEKSTSKTLIGRIVS